MTTEKKALITGITGQDRSYLAEHPAVRWNASKPDGQPRRSLDTARARWAFGFASRTAFADGLRETIGWYETAAVALKRD